MNIDRRVEASKRHDGAPPPRRDIATKNRRQRAPKMCEGCGLKQPGYGLPLDGKKRWCGSCAQAEGAVLLQKRNVCEVSDCVKTANFGLLSAGKRRWCGACGKAEGAVLIGKQKMCDSCGLQHANFGLPEEGKRRWCGGCADQFRNAVTINLSQPKTVTMSEPTPKTYLWQAHIMLTCMHDLMMQAG
jgi:hypothetical protein